LSNSNTATSRLVGEELLISSVHLGEVGHISEEDIDLDNLVDAGPGSVNNGLDIVAAGLCLFADVALDEVAGSVSGDLAGDEELAVGTDGLGLKTFDEGSIAVSWIHGDW
jgi:hypothetical protein